MYDPKWHSKQKKVAEKEWEISLAALGLEKVRELLIQSGGAEVVKTIPAYRTKHPETGRDWEFFPETEFVTRWLAAKQQKTDAREKASENRALKMQWIALAISFLGAAAVIANVVRLFVNHAE